MENYNLFDVAAYIRLSCEDGDKEESNSVGNQRKLINEYISKHDDFRKIEYFVDDGFTGTNFNRPAFKRMIEDIDCGRFDCVIVKDLSRFGRDYIDTGRYLERYFPDKGVRFISITDGIDSMQKAYDMLLPIKNLFNEQYAKDISDKIQATVKAKQHAGEFIGAFACYGYKKSPVDKNKLIIDEYAAEVVRRIFRMFIQGTGKQRIAKILNSEGILCPSEYKRMNGENYVNSNRLGSTTYWSYSTINNILQKEMYCGNMVQGTRHQQMRRSQKRIARKDWIVVKNTHEPIIDEATWDKTQELLKRRTRKLDLADNNHIFSGFVKCGDCGRAMVRNTWKRSDGTKSSFLYCSTYKAAGRSFCTPHSLPMDTLHGIILDDLNTIISNIDDLKSLYDNNKKYLSDVKKNCESEIDTVKKDLEKVRKLKKSVYEDYKEDLITKKDFLAYQEEYQGKEELLAKKLSHLEKKALEDSADNLLSSEWIRHLLEMKRVEQLDREMIVEMIHEIIVFEDRRIKIIYNFSDELKDLFPKTFEKNIFS